MDKDKIIHDLALIFAREKFSQIEDIELCDPINMEIQVSSLLDFYQFAVSTMNSYDDESFESDT